MRLFLCVALLSSLPAFAQEEPEPSPESGEEGASMTMRHSHFLWGWASSAERGCPSLGAASDGGRAKAAGRSSGFATCFA